MAATPTPTPMMRQYLELKEKYQDCILFFRLGDFYEMFFDDAKLASKELELTLTGKDCGLSERAPMCGVPYHAASAYISVSYTHLDVYKRQASSSARAGRSGKARVIANASTNIRLSKIEIFIQTNLHFVFVMFSP